jgi:peptidoglycan DL-endopeptidase CwlO
MSVFTPRGRHAKPSATRTAVRTGLTASLIPMALALPALGGTASAAPSAAVGLVGPTTTVRPGTHAFRVHVVQNGRSLANAPVRFDVTTSGGRWRNAGVVRTNRTGTAYGALSLGSSVRVRAVALTRAVSRPISVSVARPAASRARAAARTAPGGDFRSAALRVALAQVGKPYRWGATGPSSFDCSGLVNYAFRSVGRSVPRTSSQLRAWTVPVSRASARPGDLVFSPGHVGIYVRPGVMIDAPNSGGRVSVRSIYARNYTIGRVR